MSAKLVIHQAFLDFIIPAALRDEKISKVPAEVTVGQAILESSWGQSKLTVLGNNLFGIKASPDWTGGTLSLPGSEYINGKWIHELMVWKKYDDYGASIKDHSEFLHKTRYKEAFNHTNDWKEFLNQIWKAGYATDPEYVKEVISVLETSGVLGAISSARLQTNTEAQLLTKGGTST